MTNQGDSIRKSRRGANHAWVAVAVVAALLALGAGGYSLWSISNSQSQLDALQAEIQRLESDLSEARSQLEESSQMADDALSAAQNTARDLDDVAGDVERTRTWVGDLAHCLVLEAEAVGYSYWLTSTGPFLGNQGTSVFDDQMSHCE